MGLGVSFSQTDLQAGPTLSVLPLGGSKAVTALESNTGDFGQPVGPDLTAAVPSPVCLNDGPFKGFEGIIVERRTSGRYLIQLHQGVYVEANLVEFSPSTKSNDKA